MIQALSSAQTYIIHACHLYSILSNLGTYLLTNRIVTTIGSTLSGHTGGKDGFQLYTMDHGSGTLRMDLEHRWDDASSPVPFKLAEELLCDPSGGWLCSSNVEGGDLVSIMI